MTLQYMTGATPTRWFGPLRDAVRTARQRAADIGLGGVAAAMFEVGFVAGYRLRARQQMTPAALKAVFDAPRPTEAER